MIEKKKYVIPEAEIISYSAEDIITKSLNYDPDDAEAGWEDGPYDNW